MNGDIYHDIDLNHLINTHRVNDDAVTMALHDYPRFNSVLVEQDRVRGFSTDKEQKNLLAFTGIHVVQPEIIEQIPAKGFFHIIDLYQQLAQEGKIGEIRVDGSFWQDMGTPKDYLDLHRHLLSTQTPCWQIHKSARIGKNVELQGWGAIGAGTIIGEGARLAQCIIWENAQIAAGAEITNEIIFPAETT
jgi:mannose-1-phosphate guanylyltransferase